MDIKSDKEEPAAVEQIGSRLAEGEEAGSVKSEEGEPAAVEQIGSRLAEGDVAESVKSEEGEPAAVGQIGSRLAEGDVAESVKSEEGEPAAVGQIGSRLAEGDVAESVKSEEDELAGEEQVGSEEGEPDPEPTMEQHDVDGDVAVGRNVAIGGHATIQGDMWVNHNLRVEGQLILPNGQMPDADKKLDEHIATKGDEETSAHVKLTDAIDKDSPQDVSDDTAVTPKAVVEYLNENSGALESVASYMDLPAIGNPQKIYYIEDDELFYIYNNGIWKLMTPTWRNIKIIQGDTSIKV